MNELDGPFGRRSKRPATLLTDVRKAQDGATARRRGPLLAPGCQFARQPSPRRREGGEWMTSPAADGRETATLQLENGIDAAASNLQRELLRDMEGRVIELSFPGQQQESFKNRCDDT